MILECRQLSKTFGTGRTAQLALEACTVQFARGETCALIGPSGSGKTTLLAILGCLLSPSSGELWFDGKPINYSRKGQLIEYRRRSLGFVFQHAQLLPFLTIEQNLELVGRNAGLSSRELKQRISEVLEYLGIAELRKKRPDYASGGEKQRVAVARAILHRPPVILADEPTAALDWTNGEKVIRLLTDQARREKALLIVVTHDPRVLPMFDRTLRIDSGRLVIA